MTDTATFGYHEAAARLGVSISTLRRAIRAGRVPAPAAKGATAPLTAEWLASVKAAAKKEPGVLRRAILQKTPPFAHYQGTSAWRKYQTRVRDYYTFRAATAA
jgi:excisionase family DNA binding protein